MKRVLICFGYKGTLYSGYQKQPSKITVQEILEKAIQKVINEKTTIYSSGRTDAGVHAIKQYAHFDTNSNVSMQKLPQAINTFLPGDIRVFEAKIVDDNFHARYNVKKKTYIYVLSNSNVVSPLFYDMVTPLKYQLDMQKVNDAIKIIKGKHNFKAFCSSGTSAKDFDREIFDIQVIEQSNYLVFKVTGNGFLYNMVRIIVGTLIDIGRGRIQLENIDKMFKTGDRSLGGKTLPARGLYLFDIEY